MAVFTATGVVWQSLQDWGGMTVFTGLGWYDSLYRTGVNKYMINKRRKKIIYMNK